MQHEQERRGSVKEKTQHLTDHFTELVESYYKLGVLHVTDKATGIASFTITLFVVSLLLMFTLLFLGFGLGWWLGTLFGNMLIGFSLVAGFFVAVIITIMALRKQVLFPLIRNLIIRKVYE